MSRLRKGPLLALAMVLLAGVVGWATTSRSTSTEAQAQAPTATSAPGPTSVAGSLPPVVLDRPVNGEDAVEALGDRLDGVAASYATSPEELRQKLRTDDTLWIDTALRLYYVEPALDTGPEAGPETGSASGPQAGSPVFGNPLGLQSRPGSARVVHLDFDGHTTTGTLWNNSSQLGTGATVQSTPYDSDGNPGTLSVSEEAVIESVWQRVAEDFAAFDVNVTTADPGLAAIERTGFSDQQFGTRVVIAGTNPITATCGCGGIAYLDAFDETVFHSVLQPAFVFQAGLGGAGAAAKTLAEAASHETGHTLGLSHDGTTASAYYGGQGAWTPIMGNSYNRPIGHWSRGEYTGANNTEDDMAVMAARGISLLTDDRGDAFGTSTAFSGTASGRIGTATDVDVFSFVTGTLPSVTIAAAPSVVSPNLDVKLTLYDGAGVELASADPPSAPSTFDVATGMGATIIRALGAGTYFVKVEGVGAGNPATTGYSDYSSLGPYTVTVSPVSSPVCVAAPSGAVAWWRGQDSPAGQVGPTLQGAAAYTDAKVGRGLAFDGTNTVSTGGFPTLTNAVSIEGWVRTNNTGQVQTLASRWTWVGGDSDDVFTLFAGVNNDLLWMTDETSTRSPVGLTAMVPQLFDGSFHHVAATWDTTSMSLYIDGQQVATQPSQGGTLNSGAGTPFLLGSLAGPGSPIALTGVLDEMAVYNRSLSASEVAGINAAGSAGKC